MKSQSRTLAALALAALLLGPALIHRASADDWPTDTTLTVTPSSVAPGQMITLASVTSGTLGEGGTVTYFIDDQVVATGSVASNGKASRAIKAPGQVGTYTAKAVYGRKYLGGGWEDVTHYEYDPVTGRLIRVWTTREWVEMWLASSSGSASFTVDDSPPRFLVQPTNQIVAVGSDATFSANVGGPLPLFYQWVLGVKPLTGQTNSALILTNLQSDQAGVYSLIVSNSLGAATSSNAALTVYSVSTSLSPAQDAVVTEGSAVTFNVTGAGPVPLTYRWTKNGADLTGQTGSGLTLENVQEGDAGAYGVVISDGLVANSAAAGSFRVVPALVVLGGAQQLSDGGFQFSLATKAGRGYPIIVSTDLVHWSLLTNVVSGGGLLSLVDRDASRYPQRFYRVAPALVPVDGMVAISPGTFLMGSPASEPDRWDDEGPQIQVTISQGFWMAKYEVTQRQYLEVMGSNPSYFTGDLDRPVERVSWNDAVAYCSKLTEQERAAGRLPAGYEYRLPTEAQWEYACRAGSTTTTAFGNSLSSTQANFNGNYPYNGGAEGPYLKRTTAVGSYAPNAWGLYDMHGNVWEWCADWYFSSYPGGSVTDPKGPGSGSDRVDRGGGWLNGGRLCRSALRDWGRPGDRADLLGFRLALVAVP